MQVSLIVSDVDGVLNDGRLLYADEREFKSFHVRDGIAVKMAQGVGIPVAILSGRRSVPIERRARELGIEILKVGRGDKQTALEEIRLESRVEFEHMAYVGDDLPDLAPIKLAGVSFCPCDSVPEILNTADVICPRNGGHGVLRYVVETLLKAQGKWRQACQSYEVQHG